MVQVQLIVVVFLTGSFYKGGGGTSLLNLVMVDRLSGLKYIKFSLKPHNNSTFKSTTIVTQI
jgi:hypothetical protein